MGRASNLKGYEEWDLEPDTAVVGSRWAVVAGQPHKRGLAYFAGKTLAKRAVGVGIVADLLNT